MIKKISSLLIFCFVVFYAQAQLDTPARKTSFGISAGYADIQFKSKNSFPYTLMDPGVDESFYVGMSVDVPLGEDLLFNPQLKYIFPSKSTGYLEVAPLIKYHIFNSGIHFLAGPQLKLITSKVAENYKRTGFEVAGGLGYNFGKRWLVEAKYAYELTNRYEEDIAPTGNSEMHFETLTVGVGYRF